MNQYETVQYVVEVSRMKDNFRQRTAIGSYEGCLKEAKSIVRRLTKAGQTFHRMGPRDWQSDALVLVEIWAMDSRMPKREIEWTPKMFFKRTIKALEKEARDG